MHNNQLRDLCLLIFVAILCIIFMDFTTAAQSSESFHQLSEAEQTRAIVDAITQRVEHGRNISYKLTTWLHVHPYVDGVEGEEIVREYPKKQYQHWVYDRRYRMDIAYGVQQIVATYDVDEGVSRGTVQIKDKLFGRIDTVEDIGPMRNNYYERWLARDYWKYTDALDSIFPHMLKHQGGWNTDITDDGNTVQVSYIFDHAVVVPEPTDECVFECHLDIEKNFFPKWISITWRRPHREQWGIDEYIVEESEEVDGVWMPILLTLKAKSCVLEGKMNITTLEVSEIEHGTVTEEDVTMIFPEGAEIVDAIKGVTYDTDKNGEPIQSTIEMLYDLDPSQVDMMRPEEVAEYESKEDGPNYFMMLGGFVLIALAALIVFRKAKAS